MNPTSKFPCIQNLNEHLSTFESSNYLITIDRHYFTLLWMTDLIVPAMLRGFAPYWLLQDDGNYDSFDDPWDIRYQNLLTDNPSVFECSLSKLFHDFDLEVDTTLCLHLNHTKYDMLTRPRNCEVKISLFLHKLHDPPFHVSKKQAIFPGLPNQFIHIYIIDEVQSKVQQLKHKLNKEILGSKAIVILTVPRNSQNSSLTYPSSSIIDIATWKIRREYATGVSPENYFINLKK